MMNSDSSASLDMEVTNGSQKPPKMQKFAGGSKLTKADNEILVVDENLAVVETKNADSYAGLGVALALLAFCIYKMANLKR
ncbi:MAG: hypothetical protein ACFHVJ_10780 [Aestuariibacter sp.]